VNDGTIGRAVRQLTGAWLNWREQVKTRERAADLHTRVEGYRVVDGGQTDSDGSWEITDAESGELLARGVGIDSYEDAWQDSWHHVDSIGTEAFDSTPEPDGDSGLPPKLAEALREWVLDQPDEAEGLIEEQPKIAKSDEQLDDMVSHIRYEVVKLIGFLGIGNGWVHEIEGLPDGWATFAGESMLEAALIHTRCVAEFLRRSDQPDDPVTARDYVSGWHWTKGEGLKNDLAEIHGRVAHLGFIRRSVQHEGEDFSWLAFLQRDAVPTLLGGFRDFLGRLDAELVERFNQPTTDHERIDLAAVITTMIGPPDDPPG
jgi:hypothetical protein